MKKPIEKELADLRERVKKLEREWLEEHRVVECLVAAGHVKQSKVDEARTLVQSFR